MKHPLFPAGKSKAVVMSYDDGKTQDRRLVEMFNRHGIRGTFHLNSGTLDQPGYIRVDEAASLYEGHEVSSHTVTHPRLPLLTNERIVEEIIEDRKALEAIVRYPVRGMSYPYGTYDDRVVHLLSSLGIEYARTVVSTGGYTIPKDFLRLPATCHHNDKLLERTRHFLDQPAYMTSLYTLGTFNRCDMWNQRRPLAVYWGTPDHVGCLRFRCMHDGYDFSSGLLHTVQHRNVALGLARFCTDHGDKHFVLDPIEGKITASSLSFRFEFGGETSGLQLPDALEPGEPWVVRSPYVKIGIMLADLRFGIIKPRIKTASENGCMQLDFMLYEGQPEEFDLAAIGDAHAAFGLVVESAACEDADLIAKLHAVRSERKNGTVRVSYSDEYHEMGLAAKTGVHPFRQAMGEGEGYKETRIRPGSLIWSV